MSEALLAGGLLATATAAVHLVAGHRDIVSPLLSSPLADEPKRTLHGCWHLVTILLVGSAVALLGLAADPGASGAQALGRFIAVLHLAGGLLFIAEAWSAGGPGRLLQLPQWTLLLPIGALSWAGSA